MDVEMKLQNDGSNYVTFIPSLFIAGRATDSVHAIPFVSGSNLYGLDLV